MSWYTFEEKDEQTGNTRYYCADWCNSGSPFRFKSEKERDDFVVRQQRWWPNHAWDDLSR
jgi:hypothetical protein